MRNRTVVFTAVAVALVVIATLATAQTRERGPSGGEGMLMDGPRGVVGPIGRMLNRLDLSDEQQAKVEAILDEARPGMQSLRDQLHQSRETFRAAHPPETFDEAAIRAHAAEQNKIKTELAVLAARTRSRVLAVLTAEQLAELKAMRERFEEFADEFGPGRGHRAGRAPRGW
jgi:Spy/CpxP family protein refolding chaperone